MPERNGNGSTNPAPPAVFALSTPRNARSYDEPAQDEYIGDIRDLLNELKDSFREMSVKIDAQEMASSETKDVLRQLVPKIDDVAGFIKHRLPALAERSDLIKLEADLKEEIVKRPTRRQTILDLAWVFGLIVAAVAFGSRLAH